jgi:transcriptional regulator GlxA family with amidase domain
LATSAAMSRTAFAQCFRELTGETPICYLARWRVQLATEQPTATHLLMVEIAKRCGYASEVAFRKSFRRLRGVAPGAYRKRNRTPSRPSSAIPT